MAYNASFPADDSYLSDFPAGDREQTRALKDDQIVNAGKLQGLTIGNKNGQIPINNGTENANLNAALLNGKASSYFATSNHSHTTATQSSNGYMSNADKKKLDGIASGAEVNQNAFANVKVGTTTIQADAKQDTLTLAAGANIALTPDGNNDKVTIGVTGKVASATTADKVSATASNNGTLDLVAGTMASNDYFRIRIGGSSDSGYAEIATADNGNESIYIRQYGGSRFGFSDSPLRTATILDGSGNTSFPGRVTANGGFSGNLSGTATNATNATSATKATQDRNGLQIDTNYLKLSGGTMNGILSTSKTTNTYLAGNQGQAIINSTAGNGAYTMLAKMNSNNGKFTHGVYQNGYLLQYTTNSTISAGTNAVTKSVTLLDESGNTSFPGTVTASSFNGTATKATQDKNGLQIDTNYLKRSGGTITGQLTMGTGTEVQIKAPNNTGFYFNSGALGCYNWSGTNGGSIFSYSPSSNTFAFGKAVTAPTPGTSDNGTRVATTAFVRNLLNGGSFGTISAISLNTNGYVKFSNGLIIQWGSYSSGRQGYPTASNSFNFPIAFPSVCYSVVLAPQDFDIYKVSWSTTKATITSATVSAKATTGKQDGYTNAVRYIAIGK